jgi:hypothetical protein
LLPEVHAGSRGKSTVTDDGTTTAVGATVAAGGSVFSGTGVFGTEAAAVGPAEGGSAPPQAAATARIKTNGSAKNHLL